jgi:diguanylate cyclase (GGDEF)-like protein
LEKLLETLLESTGRPSARSRAQVIERTLGTALALSDAHGAVLLLPAGRSAWRHVLIRGHREPQRVQAPRDGTEFSRLLARGAVALHVPDAAQDPRVSASDACPGVESGPALFVPLRLREHSPGYLAIFRHPGAARFGERESMLVTALAVWASLTIENLRLAASVEKLAVTDDLTQVYNYRFLKSALRREIKRASRFRQKLSILMVDVDNLKAYNDRNGHLRGSHLLKLVAGRFASQVRSFDLVAKYGGDEFTIILPQTDREGAVVVAERMRASVEEKAFPLAPQGSITVSLGVATFPDDAEDANGLIQASDRALYAAKRRGRNRVETVQREAA